MHIQKYDKNYYEVRLSTVLLVAVFSECLKCFTAQCTRVYICMSFTNFIFLCFCFCITKFFTFYKHVKDEVKWQTVPKT